MSNKQVVDNIIAITTHTIPGPIASHKAISLVNKWEAYFNEYPNCTNMDVIKSVYTCMRPDQYSIETCNEVVSIICEAFNIPSYGKLKL